MNRWGWICLVVWAQASLGLAAVSFPVKFGDGKGLGLEPAPTWLGAGFAAKNYGQQLLGRQVLLAVADPGLEMKWIGPVSPLQRPGRFLNVRYAATHVGRNGNGDSYFLWLHDGKGPFDGGYTVMDLSEIVADGNWRTVSIDLSAHVMENIDFMSLHLTATKDGPATFWLEYLDFSNSSQGEILSRTAR